MEFIQLCQQLKSLASSMSTMISADLISQLSKVLSLNDIQVSAIYADSMIVLAYLILLISKTNAARFKVLVAYLCTLVVAYTPIYGALSQVGYYCALAVIYFTAHKNIKSSKRLNTGSKKIKSTLVIMVFFQMLVAIDAYDNPTIETWLFRNYEEVTLCIHLLICTSCLKLKPIDLGAILGRFINSLRGLAHSNCLAPRL